MKMSDVNDKLFAAAANSSQAQMEVLALCFTIYEKELLKKIASKKCEFFNVEVETLSLIPILLEGNDIDYRVRAVTLCSPARGELCLDSLITDHLDPESGEVKTEQEIDTISEFTVSNLRSLSFALYRISQDPHLEDRKNEVINVE